MLDDKPLKLHGEETIHLAKPQERNPKTLVFHGELLILCTFIAVSTYLTVRLALQTGRLAQTNTLHEHSITLINDQLKQQTDHLAAFERTDREVLQSLRETNLRNQRIETRLTQIEDDHMALKRANARILANEQKLGDQLDVVKAQIGQGSSTIVDIPVNPPPAAPADHSHPYVVSGLRAPKGVRVDRNAQGEEIWLVSKDGKQQEVRPIEQTRLGYRIHNLTDGKDYTLTPEGDWLASSAR
jgi:hypothetical protein